ncbi:MAG: Smr/MutS family protein [Bacteroidota bacterium]
MIFPDNFELKSDFQSIKLVLKELCMSPAGSTKVDGMRFLDTLSAINTELSLVVEFLDVLQSNEKFPSQDYYDMAAELHRVKLEGTYLEPEQLAELRLSYITIVDIVTFFYRQQELYPLLFGLSKEFQVYDQIVDGITRILDDKGHIRDTASDDLKKIRTSIRSTQIQIEKRLHQILNALKKDNIIQSDSEMTLRNGRCVIPVGVANKRKVKGFIHDESASGQTAFIEPAEIFDMNNSLRELESAERKEIIKILLRYAASLRPQLPEIAKAYSFLGTVDFIRAKALLAHQTHAVKPRLVDTQEINWQQARNPVLAQRLKAQKKEVVPFDLVLNAQQRIIVISGPNAGGKSVCLKTVGLLQYMLQCGLLITVKENSTSGVFSKLFIEIGDEQSIENDLSTYSSHLTHLNYFLQHAQSDTLFLIDEFGSGTEPQLGGAIAEATLEALNAQKALGVVSTHYANLKEFAAKTAGVVNASMLFDSVKMQPLYKLRIGNSGSSYAFEIAEKIGYPTDIINKAINLSGKEKITFEKQIQQFEIEKEALAKQQEKITMADNFLSEMIDKYQLLLTDLDSQRKQMLRDAKAEAENLLLKANSTIEKTIKQIKEAQAEKQLSQAVRTDLKTRIETLVSEEKPESVIEKKSPIRKHQEQLAKIPKKETVKITPQKGNFVKIPGQKQIGEIVEIKKDQAIVLYNNLKMRLPLHQLEVATKKEFTDSYKNITKSNYSDITHQVHDKIADFKTTLDVRGKKAEEIYTIIEKYIDDALLLKNFHIRILHGKGGGVLRRIIREMLSSHKDVACFSDEQLELGGDGITVVTLK